VSEQDWPSIGDYGMIGDCRTAALVCRDGSIAWFCVPYFDGPSVFGAILDREKGGRFRVGPTGQTEISRRYLDRTNVLETTFRTAEGEVKITDVMAVDEPDDLSLELRADHEILRKVECTAGTAEVEVICEPRPDYGRRAPRIVDQGRFGVSFCARNQMLRLLSEIDVAVDNGNGRVTGRETLRAGERRFVSLTHCQEMPEVIPPLGESAEVRLRESVKWWRSWSNRSDYDGYAADLVHRSALVLKLMAFAPSGAIVAAPTTSLPEAIGGVRNWDYRYCWLRDATLVIRALLHLGHVDEADAFLGWLLHATKLTAPELRVLYTVYGESKIREWELDHLTGYRHSKPVRVGNGAADQLQLDVYGAVIGAACDGVRCGLALDRDEQKLLRGLGEVICRSWRQPDEGIWELRKGATHQTHSKFMCWFGLDRLLHMHANGAIRVPEERFRRERDAIRDDIETRGWSESEGAYVGCYDCRNLDAAVLQMIWLGYDDPNSPRLESTCRRIYERLGADGLLYRYRDFDDGLPGTENAFGVCSFWGIEALTHQGEVDKAISRFEDLRQCANDLGLYAEEIDPRTREAIGNFPQAFTHIGLINAARAIDRAQRGKPAEFEPEEKSLAEAGGLA